VKADILVTDCLSCKHNLQQGVPFEGKLRVLATPEYLLEGIETGRIKFSKIGDGFKFMVESCHGEL